MSELLQQHLAQLAVNGTEIPVALSSFQELSIVENISVKLPTLRFVYSDANNSLVDNPLTDGTKVSVVLHSANYRDPEAPLEFGFRAMGAKYKPAGNRMIVTCAGIFDRMEYLRKIQKMPVEGPSSEGIRKVLSENGFGKFDIPDSTSDKMWWRPNNQMHFVEGFARHMATHGMAGKESVMSLGISDDGTAHYRDVAKLAKQNPSRTVTPIDRVNADRGDVPLMGWEVKSLGGLTNLLTGYGSQVTQEKLTGSAFVIDDILSPMLGGALNMDSALKGLIGDVNRLFVPTDLGNQHDKFYQAKEQNTRGLQQLQSTSVEFATNQATGLKIYDVVDFQPYLPTNNALFTLVTGPYIITSKTRYFQGAQFYREKFTLCRSGMGNSKGQVGYSAS